LDVHVAVAFLEAMAVFAEPSFEKNSPLMGMGDTAVVGILWIGRWSVK